MTMRVQISSSSFQPIKAQGTETLGAPLLSDAGPRAIIGWTPGPLQGAVVPSAETLFGPRGVCLHPDGTLWVSDTGHHRLLGWRSLPQSDNVACDVLIGQTDFSREGRNGNADPGPSSLNVPTGLCAFREGLAVADAWNHRVLIWHQTPQQFNQPADIVLGQTEFSSTHANRGNDRPTAATLNWPYGIAVVDEHLVVADTGNRRLLVWRDPHASGQDADLVLGQRDFTTRDENAGDEVSALGMRWPHGIAFWQGHLAVSDAGNNRVMCWVGGLPDENGKACDFVVGQPTPSSCDHNAASYYPTSATMNMPYDIAVVGDTLIVTDTANSRLVGFTDAAMGASAAMLSGQADFASKGDNRWGLPERDSVCWPYGLSALDNMVAIADSGNNRVMLWEAA